jgi:hypothetical protein
MKIKVDDDTELANSVKLSDSERAALDKAEDDEKL